MSVWDYIKRNANRPDDWSSEELSGADFRELSQAHAEIERLRADKKAMTYQLSHLCAESDRAQAAAKQARNNAIEECARVAQQWLIRAEQGSGEDLIDAILALKDNPKMQSTHNPQKWDVI